MKTMKIWGLGIFAFAGIASMILLAKILLVDGLSPKSLHTKKTVHPTVIENSKLVPIRPDGKEEEKLVEISIGEDSMEFTNAVIVLVETRDGEVTMFSANKLFKPKDPERNYSQNGIGGYIEESNYSMQNLMLQAVTASSNVYAAIPCCSGLHQTAGGDSVPPMCPKKTPMCPN